MRQRKNMGIYIRGTGLFTPKESISNEELVESYNSYVDIFNEENKESIQKGEVESLTYSDPGFIKKASGIESRFVINKDGILDPRRMKPRLNKREDNELSIQAEIAIEASKQALINSDRDTSDIDGVICACANLQRAYPAVSIEIQGELGIEGYAYDMNVACSSATFGIQNAVNDIRSGVAKTLLVVNPEICTAHLNFKDRDGHFIFGDVCTALIIEKTDKEELGSFEIIDTKLKTSFSNNIRNNFGFISKNEDLDLYSDDQLFKQEGRKVFKQVVPMVQELIENHLEKNNISIENIKRLWLHQANLNMNSLIAKRLLGRDPTEEEMPTVLNEYANTSSAGSIIAFHKYSTDLEKGDLGVICSFGAGYSVGSIIVQRT